MDEATLKDMWGALALRGAAAILFGVAAVFWPGMTLVTLVYLFGAFMLVSGLINQVSGLLNLRGGDDTLWSRVLLILVGLAEVAVGVYLLRHPLVTFATLILIIGLTLIIRALVDIFTGIFGDSSGTYRTMHIIGGLLSGLVGVIMLFQPAASGVAFVWILGLYALVTGPLLVAMAFDIKNGKTNSRGKRA